MRDPPIRTGPPKRTAHHARRDGFVTDPARRAGGPTAVDPSMPFTATDYDPYDFANRRHIGPSPREMDEMFATLGVTSLDDLIDQTIPVSLRQAEPLDFGAPLSERELLWHMRQVAKKNRVLVTMIGQGYHGTVTPPAIQRNILENPAWYTAYTPYQPEISQGRLEALLNFQTMVCDLTGMDIANASLLDEATAAAEAMAMARAGVEVDGERLLRRRRTAIRRTSR